MPSYWQPEDRVYSVAYPALTGTVVSIEPRDLVRVRWDAYPHDLGARYTERELDWYTRPAPEVS
jgi:hypothetical protein